MSSSLSRLLAVLMREAALGRRWKGLVAVGEGVGGERGCWRRVGGAEDGNLVAARVARGVVGLSGVRGGVGFSAGRGAVALNTAKGGRSVKWRREGELC